RLSSFLGCPLAPGTLAALEQHCSFSAMRDNAMANYSLIPAEIMDHSQGRFMRKGEGKLAVGLGREDSHPI
ncbi:ST2B1 Sulfotransferase, partial [Oxylabes madagascariensis]|nr:ST2B1 Sulfotransferase [Oxylabes madagascariensis]